MWPTWGPPGSCRPQMGPHIGHMNLAIRVEVHTIMPMIPSRYNTLLQLIHHTLLWRHYGCDSVSNHQPHEQLLNRLFRRRSKKTSKLRVTGLCAGKSSGTDEFPTQMASNAENVSIWWRHHVCTVARILEVTSATLNNNNDFCMKRRCVSNKCNFNRRQTAMSSSTGVFFNLRLIKRLSKQSWGWWFETPSWSYDVSIMITDFKVAL